MSETYISEIVSETQVEILAAVNALSEAFKNKNTALRRQAVADLHSSSVIESGTTTNRLRKEFEEIRRARHNLEELIKQL